MSDNPDETWAKIRAAFAFVNGGSAERVDGPFWKVYRVGSAVRIDIGGPATPLPRDWGDARLNERSFA